MLGSAGVMDVGRHFLLRVVFAAFGLKRCFGLGSWRPRVRDVPLPLALVRFRRVSFLITPDVHQEDEVDLRDELTLLTSSVLARPPL